MIRNIFRSLTNYFWKLFSQIFWNNSRNFLIFSWNLLWKFSQQFPKKKIHFKVKLKNLWVRPHYAAWQNASQCGRAVNAENSVDINASRLWHNFYMPQNAAQHEKFDQQNVGLIKDLPPTLWNVIFGAA